MGRLEGGERKGWNGGELELMKTGGREKEADAEGVDDVGDGVLKGKSD